MATAFSRIMGGIFLLAGILGFFFESLFGVLHVNLLHNCIHLAFGFWGILASAQEGKASFYARSAGILYALAGLAGLAAPALLQALGAGWPDHVLHLTIGAVALYIGFRAERVRVVKPRRKSAGAAFRG
jgi:hypothetical protein